MKVTVHIERVISDRARDRRIDADQLAESIRAELSNRIVSDGLPALLRSASMQPDLPSDGPRQPIRAGAGVGDALYGRLDR